MDSCACFRFCSVVSAAFSKREDCLNCICICICICQTDLVLTEHPRFVIRLNLQIVQLQHLLPALLLPLHLPTIPLLSTALVSMPSLGFLKKKRTRDVNSDPSGSQPSSPVTPSNPSKSFEPSPPIPNPAPPTTSQAHPSTASATSQPSVTSQQIQQQQQQPQEQQTEPTSNVPMYNSHLHQAHASAPAQSTPSPFTEQQQNLPRIANLVNPPQNDGPGHTQHTYQQQQLGKNFPAPPVNDGLVGHQSQQPHYAHTMPHQQQQQHSLQQQPIQPQHVAAQQPQPVVDQPRVTKGKYSLADFEILRTLGTGSFGRVHLVQSRHNQRFYAVKVLKKAQVVKMKQVEHTNDERKMLGEVKHPFLITLWGTFQDPRNLYMVMDFVEGGELFSLLRKSGVSPPYEFHVAER